MSDMDSFRTRLVEALARTSATTARVRLGKAERPDRTLEAPVKVGVADLANPWMRVIEPAPEWAVRFGEAMAKTRPAEQGADDGSSDDHSLEILYDGAEASVVDEGQLRTWPAPAYPPLWLFVDRESITSARRSEDDALMEDPCERFDGLCRSPKSVRPEDVSIAAWVDAQRYVRRVSWQSGSVITAEEAETFANALDATSGIPELEKSLLPFAPQPSNAAWEVLELSDFGVTVER